MIEIPAWVDGTLTPVEKLAVHRRGLRHKAISVFVMHQDEILLQQRALCKYHTPGLWANTCCTHPGWTETSVDCARRRLEEELGITGLTLDFRDRVEYRAAVGNGLIEHEVVDVFVAQTGPTVSITPNPEEVMDVTWMTYHDLCAEVEKRPERFTPWLRIYLDKHAARIFDSAVLASV